MEAEGSSNLIALVLRNVLLPMLVLTLSVELALSEELVEEPFFRG